MDRLDGHLTWEDPISDGIECPHCGALLDEDVYHASSQDTLQVYRCSGCGRYTTEREMALATDLATAIERLSTLYYLASAQGDFSNGVEYNGIDEGQSRASDMLVKIRAFLAQHDDKYATQDGDTLPF